MLWLFGSRVAAIRVYPQFSVRMFSWWTKKLNRSCLLFALMRQNDSSVYPVMFGSSLTYWGLVHSYGQGECDLRGCDWELHPFSIRTQVVFFVGLL